MRVKFVILLYFLFSCISWAQENRQKYVGVETGITFIQGDMSDMDNVRGDIPDYYGGYSTSNLTSLSYKSFVGIKSEIFSLNDRFGLLVGLRYSNVNSSVGKKSYWNSNTNYFYWLSNTDGVNTEFLKVKEITQKSDYIGVPVEIRFFPAKRPRIARFYFKLGAELNYLIQTQKDVVFYDDAMNPYKNEVTAKIAKPKSFYGSIYCGYGLRIGKDLKPSVSIEVCMPYLFLTSKSYGLLNPIVGSGFQLNVQVPIKSKKL